MSTDANADQQDDSATPLSAPVDSETRHERTRHDTGLIAQVHRAAIDYQDQHQVSRIKANYLADILGVSTQTVGYALGRLRDHDLADKQPAHAGSWWFVDPNGMADEQQSVSELLSIPNARPESLEIPDDYLIQTDALPDWVPQHMEQIAIDETDDGQTVYPCPDPDCDGVFDHPDGAFRHCSRAHRCHYLEVLYGDLFGRLLIDLHRQHRMTPTMIRDVIPMSREVIADNLHDLDAFIPFVNRPESKRPERYGIIDENVDGPVGIDGKPLKNYINVDAAILDD